MTIRTYQLISASDAGEMLAKIRTLEWKQGQARTAQATGTIKRNLEIRSQDNKEALDLLVRLQRRLAQHTDIIHDTLHHRILCPKFNRYTPDSPEYKRHGDAATMGGSVRTDLSCTIFLTPPDEYEGGGLCIEDSFGGFVEVRGNPGQCVIYDGGNPHWVTPVTKGERISAVTWIQSYFRDPEQRDILCRFGRVLRKMESESDDLSEEYVTLGIINAKLMRMWTDIPSPPTPLPPPHTSGNT